MSVRMSRRAVAFVLAVGGFGLAGCTGVSSEGGEPTPTPVQTFEARTQIDVRYADGAEEAHLLDVFHPGSQEGPLPLVVFVHGGGWHSGDKNQAGAGGDRVASPLTDLLLENGYAVASVNYRLSGEASFPAPIHDVKAAIRHLRAHAEEYGVDPDRIGVAGESAGGHLALLAGTTMGDDAYEGDLGTTDASSDVAVVVSYYGLSDVRDRGAMAIDAGCPPRDNPGPDSEERMLGASVDTPEGQRIASEASPLLQVSEDDPPTLFLSGNWDCTAPPLHSIRMHDALAEAGVTTRTVSYDLGHGADEFYTMPEAQQEVLTFLDAELKGSGSTSTADDG